MKTSEYDSIMVNPAVLRWLVENDGRDTETLSKFLGANKLQKWLDGSEKPNLRELKKLANVLRRPLAAFLIPEPPKEQKISNFRLVNNSEIPRQAVLSRREILRLQMISKELLENLNKELNPKVSQIDMEGDMNRLSSSVRSDLNLEALQQSSIDSKDLFRRLREQIESKNIFVFLLDAPINDFRGFALSTNPSVIVVNSKDIPEARIFTLMHEYAHVLLRENGMCLQEKYLESQSTEAKTENWCNEFAATCLLPKEAIEKDFKYEGGNVDKLLAHMHRKYKVSKAASLFRLYNLHLINKPYYYDNYKKAYKEKLEKIEEIALTAKKRKEALKIKEGLKAKLVHPAIAKKKINARGKAFVNLIKENANKRAITTAEALDYLGIGIKAYEKYIET